MIKEMYEKIGGDYTQAISRMQNDERIKKYLGFFLMDESYTQLEDGITTKNCEEAFRGAHTLKGVCQNMAFTELSIVVSEITEELRANNFEKAKEMFLEVKKEYERVINAIKNIM